jgi:hypothetical protein
MAISILQSNCTGLLNPGSGTFTLSFNSNNTANNGLVYLYQVSGTLNSISDSNNTLGAAIEISTDSGAASPSKHYIYFVPKCAAGANTVSINSTLTAGSSGFTFYRLTIIEIQDSGGNTNGFTADLTGGNVGTTDGSGNLSWSLGTTMQAHEIAIAQVGIFGTSAVSAGSGWTADQASQGYSNLDEYQVLSATAAITVSFASPDTSADYNSVAASFYTAIVAPPSGWMPGNDRENFFPPKRRLDDTQPFFLRPAAAATSAPMVGWMPGRDAERPILLRRNDDGAPFFLPAKQPLWVPRLEGAERPAKPVDQSASPFVAQAPTVSPVGVSGMAWHLPQEGMRPPGPKEQYGITWDPQKITAAAATTIWLPTAGDTDLRLLPPRRNDEPAFVAIVQAVPSIAGWKAGDGNEKPLVIRRVDEAAGFFVAPAPVSTPNVLWFVPYDQPPRLVKPDVSAPSFTLKPPPPPVGISGMAWWQQIEVHLPPPPPQLDYAPGWDPQFVVYVPPPPPNPAQFTVSGYGVSLTFTEFFVDVVFTDAPVTKRTN